jgi:beta-lactamase class A
VPILAALLMFGGLLPRYGLATTRTGTVTPDDGDDPVATWVYDALNAAQVDALLTKNNARLVDVEVDTTKNTPRYTVTMIRDPLAHGSWTWTPRASVAELADATTTDGLRIVDLQPYRHGKDVVYTAILVKDPPSTGRMWWWFDGVTTAFIAKHVKEKNARIIDLETHPQKGRFSVVTVANSGPDAAAWEWWHGQTAAQMEARRDAFGGRITTFTVYGERYAFAMTAEATALPRVTHGLAGVADAVKMSEQFGGRVRDIERGQDGKIHVVLAENRTPYERRVIDALLGSQTTGPPPVLGLYLREVGEPVPQFSLNAAEPFEPASAIKVLPGLALMREIAATGTKPGDLAVFYNYPSSRSVKNPGMAAKDYCPAPVDEIEDNAMPTTLSNVYRTMMRDSDNRTTRTLLLRYGVGPLNEMAKKVGMQKTRLEQDLIGCGWDGGKRNTTTLNDLAALYEGVHTKKYLADSDGAWLAFWDDAAAGAASSQIAKVVSEEAKQLGLDEDAVKAFLAAYVVRGKGGSYDIACKGLHPSCTTKKQSLIIRSEAGRMCLPEFKNKNAVCRFYLTGFFLDGLVVPTGTDVGPRVEAWRRAQAEMLRPLIRRSLQTWNTGPSTSTSSIAERVPHPGRTGTVTETTSAPERTVPTTIVPITTVPTTTVPIRSTPCPTRVRC